VTEKGLFLLAVQGPGTSDWAQRADGAGDDLQRGMHGHTWESEITPTVVSVFLLWQRGKDGPGKNNAATTSATMSAESSHYSLICNCYYTVGRVVL